MPSPITLRVARPGDAPALLAVYAPLRPGHRRLV